MKRQTINILLIIGLIMIVIGPTFQRTGSEGWLKYVWGKNYGDASYGSSCPRDFGTIEQMLGKGNLQIDGITNLKIEHQDVSTNFNYWRPGNKYGLLGWAPRPDPGIQTHASILTFTSERNSKGSILIGWYTPLTMPEGTTWEEFVMAYEKVYGVLLPKDEEAFMERQIIVRALRDYHYQTTFGCTSFEITVDPNVRPVFNIVEESNKIILKTNLFNEWGNSRGGLEYTFIDTTGLLGDQEITKVTETSLVQGDNQLIFPFIKQSKEVEVKVTPYIIYSFNGEERLKRLSSHKIIIPASTTAGQDAEVKETYNNLPSQPSTTRTITLVENVVPWRTLGIILVAIVILTAGTTVLIIKRKR